MKFPMYIRIYSEKQKEYEIRSGSMHHSLTDDLADAGGEEGPQAEDLSRVRGDGRRIDQPVAYWDGMDWFLRRSTWAAKPIKSSWAFMGSDFAIAAHSASFALSPESSIAPSLMRGRSESCSDWSRPRSNCLAVRSSVV